MTKFEMAKVIVTSLYYLPKLVTEENTIAWKHAKRLTRSKKEDLIPFYQLAHKTLTERIELKEDESQ